MLRGIKSFSYSEKDEQFGPIRLPEEENVGSRGRQRRARYHSRMDDKGLGNAPPDDVRLHLNGQLKVPGSPG